MSITLPMTKLKKFYKHKEKIVNTLVEQNRSISTERQYAVSYPHKCSQIYFGINDGLGAMTYCLELEYKGVLLLFYYEPSDSEEVEYAFAFEWNPDEIERGTDSCSIHPNITEAEFFQQSLINDFQFLTLELHHALLKFCQDVTSDVETKLYEQCS